jgi:hypothetical protein
MGCASVELERRFALRAPLWQDTDLRAVHVPCSPRPTPKEPGHVSCAPAPYESPLIWDGVDNLAFRPLSDALRLTPAAEAVNVNSLDEVPDSAWFVNRLGVRPLVKEELERGGCDPSQLIDPSGYADGAWIVDKGKGGGASTGFRVTIPGKGKYLLKSDDSRPERPSAAAVIGLAIYHAAGFNTSCEQILHFKPSLLKLTPGLRYKRNWESERPFDRKTFEAIIRGGSWRGDTIRMTASAWIPGYILGPFRYDGTREDDPNDVIPHQDRRELRGSRLLAAWLARFDAREANTLDTWIAEGEGGPPDASPGRVVHYQLDTSEAFGSRWGREEVSRRLNHAYVVDFGAIVTDFLSVGIRPNPWDRVRLRPGRNIFGYYDIESFTPDRWKSEYPNAAFSRMTERDGAWMARILARFTPEMIATLAEMGQFSHPEDTAYLRQVLDGRLQRILDRYLTRLSPVTDLRLDEAGALCGVNLALRRNLRGRSSFHHQARLSDGRPLRVVEGEEGALCVPLPRPASDAGPSRYLRVTITDGVAPGALVAHLYDLGQARGYQLVGLER